MLGSVNVGEDMQLLKIALELLGDGDVRNTVAVLEW